MARHKGNYNAPRRRGKRRFETKIYLDPSVRLRLDQLADAKKTSRSELIERACRCYLERIGLHKDITAKYRLMSWKKLDGMATEDRPPVDPFLDPRSVAHLKDKG